MLIAIPTARRANRQLTVKALKGCGFLPTLFVPPSEIDHYGYLDGQAVVSATLAQNDGVAAVRDAIVRYAKEEGHRVVCMMDDDLSFFKWGPPRGESQQTPMSLYDCTRGDVAAMMRAVEKAMKKGVGSVSLLPREGGNRFADLATNGTPAKNIRHLRVHAYDVDVLSKMDAKFSDVLLMEDFHIQLSLLEKGLESVCLTQWVHDQKGTNAPGGCSTYRTSEKHAAAAHRLKELHPAFVKVRTKTTKGAWGDMGNERIDVVVRWKDAYKFGSML